jgi:hypothetical protein
LGQSAGRRTWLGGLSKTENSETRASDDSNHDWQRKEPERAENGHWARPFLPRSARKIWHCGNRAEAGRIGFNHPTPTRRKQNAEREYWNGDIAKLIRNRQVLRCAYQRDHAGAGIATRKPISSIAANEDNKPASIETMIFIGRS